MSDVMWNYVLMFVGLFIIGLTAAARLERPRPSPDGLVATYAGVSKVGIRIACLTHIPLVFIAIGTMVGAYYVPALGAYLFPAIVLALLVVLWPYALGPILMWKFKDVALRIMILDDLFTATWQLVLPGVFDPIAWCAVINQRIDAAEARSIEAPV